MRQQGLIVSPRSPNQLHAFFDLPQDDLWCIDRQSDSGKRFLLEGMSARQQIALSSIYGCDVGELTHGAVAADVASGLADARFLPRTTGAPRWTGLPADGDRTLFPHRIRSGAGLAAGLAAVRVDDALLCDDNLHQQLGALPGYDATDCGTVQALTQSLGIATTSR